MQGRPVQRKRSVREVVQAVDERVERRARAERLDRLGDALGVLDPHGPRVRAARVAVVSLVGRLTLMSASLMHDDASAPFSEHADVLERRALSAVTLASLLGLAAQLLFFHHQLRPNPLLLTAL